MSKMLAAVLHDFGDLLLEEVEQPHPREPGTVVVRIKSCGVCATDYKAIKGIRRNVTFPFIAGHEPSGVVAEVATGVTHFKVGDEVIICPSCWCGFCPQCRVGNTHYCEHSLTTGGDGPPTTWPGAFAQYMLTRETSLFAKPKGLSWDAAAVTEPLSGAWKGVIQYSQMRLGDDVAVIGVGSIGLLCMMVAKAAGAGRLIAIDTSPHARANALKLGATHAIDPSDGQARKRVYEIITDGPDLVVEAAGPIQAVRLMVELLRRGTRWNVFGITTHEKFELDGGLTHFLEARMDASFGTTPTAMSNAIRLMERGLVNTEQIISHRFPLAKIHEAMDVMGTPDHNKIIINP
ncbi:MAG: zinc-binding dehydrogenase [Phycisphaerae bacterium]